MINHIGQLMLYVHNQEESARFWTEKVGFQHITEQSNDYGMKWIEISPAKDAQTTIVLHDKKIIEEMSPELHLGTPSLMFFTSDLQALYKQLKINKVTVRDIVNIPTGKVFNFADNEGNYFAVMQK